jgi:hypothetical protein
MLLHYIKISVETIKVDSLLTNLTYYDANYLAKKIFRVSHK